MMDNKETTQNYFKGLTRKDYIERVCKIHQLRYTVILTASRN